MYKRLFRLWMLVLVSWVGTVVAQSPITSILHIRNLSPEEAGQGLDVLIEAQVVRVDPHMNHFFIFDGKHGIFVGGNAKDRSVVKSLESGDVVRVEGITTAGAFMPDIDASEVVVLENRPLPEPILFYNIDFVSTTSDCKWGLIRGRLLSMTISPEKTSILLDLTDVDSEEYQVQLPYSESSEKRLNELMFRFVELRAVCGTVANENRQMIGRIFYAHSGDEFSLAGDEWKLNTLEKKQIHELMRYNVSFNRPFQTRGVVLYADKREMFLRGEKACLKVASNEPVQFGPGDDVSLTGFIWLQPVSPAFRAAHMELIGKETYPEPVSLDLSEAIDPLLNYNLVQLDAELIEVQKGYTDGGAEAQYTMRCRSKGEFFEARLPRGIEPGVKLLSGAQVKLMGICNMQRKSEEERNLIISGFWIQLRGLDDIQILRAAPWWTKTRLFMLSGSILIIAVGSMVWIISLRRTVEHQTGIIAEKVERESIHEERQRIARDLHDNLEQGISGAIYQLGSCQRLHDRTVERASEELQIVLDEKGADDPRKSIKTMWGDLSDNLALSKDAVDRVERILRHCSEQSRSTILELRGGLLEKMDFISAVEISLEKLEQEYEVRNELEVVGEPRSLTPTAGRHILLFIKEAALNAARYSKTKPCKVTLDYSNGGLMVAIADHGCGFDVDRALQSGRLGLKGMKERITLLHGKMLIDSTMGKGTLVKATFEDMANLEGQDV